MQDFILLKIINTINLPPRESVELFYILDATNYLNQGMYVWRKLTTSCSLMGLFHLDYCLLLSVMLLVSGSFTLVGVIIIELFY